MTQNTSSEKFSEIICHCPKCNIYIKETKLEGLSLICPYCSTIL